MASHPILALRYFVSRLQELGSDPAPILGRHGLDLEKVAPDSRIDCALELRIFCGLSELVSDPAGGLKIGSSLGMSSYGQFSLMLLTCTSPWEAMQASIHYQSLSHLFSKLELRPGQQFTELTLQPPQLPAWPLRLRIDMELSGVYRLVLDLARANDLDLQVEHVCLPYPRPAESKAYEALFGCPVSFDDSHARLRISNSKLQLPLASADQMANILYRQECDKLVEIARRDTSDNLDGQVRQHLMLFQGGYPDAPATARVFGLSERSLRNHLNARGTSFRKLLDQVRYARARELLEQSSDSIEAIALQLGYAETASFIHAFQRWAGCSPARYRRMPDKPPVERNA